MSNPQKIKRELNSIIDRINNEELLDIIYQILESKEENKEGELLQKLTVAEKEELYQSYDESIDKKNLVDLDQVKKDLKKLREKSDLQGGHLLSLTTSTTT